MELRELTVEVRDKNLVRQGVIQDILNVKLSPVYNGVGTWELTLPTDHPMSVILAIPGSGIIAYGPPLTGAPDWEREIIMSGPTTSVTAKVSQDDMGGTITFTGVDDAIVLDDTLAWPQPSNIDPTKQTLSHDVRSGAAETVMIEFVNANCGPGATGPRVHPKLVMAPTQNRGPWVTKSARFPKLVELLADIGLIANLGFRVVQRGTQLQFEVFQPVDRSAFIRFDIYNGTLSSQEVALAAPGATQVIVAGQGEMVDRQFFAGTNAEAMEAEALWGRRIEAWVDQRQTNDPAELTQAVTEKLADQGFTKVTTKIVPTEDTTLRYVADWNLGDKVSVVLGDTEVTSYASGCNIVAGPNGIAMGLVLGEMAAIDLATSISQKLDALEKRLALLEKNY